MVQTQLVILKMISFVGPSLPILAIRGADDGERLWDGKKDHCLASIDRGRCS